jgi:predicted Fe-S protein YdhL (DUF1289 family)
MNPSTGLCDGCFRTIDEIAGWSSFDTEQKAVVLSQAEARKKGPRVARIGERFTATLALPPDSIKSFATLVNDHNPHGETTLKATATVVVMPKERSA